MTPPVPVGSDRAAPLLDLHFGVTWARMTHDRLKIMHVMHASAIAAGAGQILLPYRSNRPAGAPVCGSLADSRSANGAGHDATPAEAAS